MSRGTGVQTDQFNSQLKAQNKKLKRLSNQNEEQTNALRQISKKLDAVVATKQEAKVASDMALKTSGAIGTLISEINILRDQMEKLDNHEARFEE
eukprot:13328344-Ditylum_brightwellii.AAC.1